MNSRLFQSICLAITVFLICPVFASGQDPKPIQLLSPQKDTGRPLMQVLNDRKSSREFSDEKLPDQVLSNLLWAAAGVNRADLGKRTAPSAVNWQEIDIYVATGDGLFLYDSKMHALNPILPEDIRALTGRQPFVKNVPVNLVYVADFSKMGKANLDDKVLYSAADTGFISQNVYLYCASEGLATVVRGLVDKAVLGEKIKLGPDQRVILTQSVGYPKK
ncbi:MAG: nitroreductase family protein [Proteobacteria bacterium]|nr:nitroreductase family protein [Pseudomonadota bacterium]MBU4471692.1 nitroreductase family protein [Pseudomonadota bacterium]MCG2750667.1 nitroreductase family protein [Desulfobacteraceae bacterium]